jgi:hypothetical protein
MITAPSMRAQGTITADHAPVIHLVHDAQFPDAQLLDLVQSPHLVPDQIPYVLGVGSPLAQTAFGSIVQALDAHNLDDAGMETTNFEDCNARTPDETAPILALPNEILADIFEFVFAFPEPRRPESPPELLLSQITRDWRSVALNTPLLWTKIYLGFRQPLAIGNAYF